MNAEPFRFIASGPRGLADLLARELVSFGAVDVRERSTDVSFHGSLETAYRACLESRVANRVFLELGEWEVATADEYYAAARQIDWSAHIAPGATIACDFSGRHPAITHTHFGALKLKDAIVDSLRETNGFRPDVSTDRPSVRIHAHAHNTKLSISLDLSGESLHRRGYRGSAGEAPLKENVAAGVLLRAGWPEMAAAGAEFLDPMCGSGTFVIEAALIAANIAPGLSRDYFGFFGWRQHDPALWDLVRTTARAVAKPPEDLTLVLRGHDHAPHAIHAARVNAQRAGVDELVRFAVQPLSTAHPTSAKRAVEEKEGGKKGELTAAVHPTGAKRAVEEGEGGRVRRAAATADMRRGFPEEGVLAARSTDTSAADRRALRAAEEKEKGGDWRPGASAAGEDKGEWGPAAPTTTEKEKQGGAPAHAGLLVVNPPYGVRLEDLDSARRIHRELGEILRAKFEGWSAAVLTSPELGLELGIRAHRTHTLWNGPLECRLLRLKIEQDAFRERITDRGAARVDASLSTTPGARMFANRLGKNLKQLQKWARVSGITCYRLYDADMPEYAFAIDSYKVIGETGDGEIWLHVQEYAAPGDIDEESVRRRRAEAFSVLPEVTGVPAERIRVRIRRKQTRGNQYEKVAEQFKFHIVEEGGLKFRVNFDDYLDTGIFLDHRPTRARIREIAAGKRLLNLFSYTGTVTVHAAAGGATSSVSVDLSRTYLDWAERNLSLNNLATGEHELIQADCRQWLADAGRGLEKYRDAYDLIFLDPPTFSNSKRMEGVLDVSRDHASLIDACMHILAPGGLLVFSTNAQKFKLEPSLSERYDVKDLSVATVPRDFARNPRIHRCYDIRKKDVS